MKRVWKRVISILLAALMLQSVMPVQAASTKLDVPSKLTLTLYKSSKDTWGVSSTSLNKQYLVYSPNKVSSLKSSNSKVVKVSKVNTSGGSGASIYLTAQKAGTATVSFKTGGRTYKVKVTVVNYKNPVSSIVVGDTKIAGSKFNNAATYSLKYSKFADKKVKVTVNLKKGWSIEESEYAKVSSDGDVTITTGTYLEYLRSTWAKSDLFKNGKKVTIKGGAGFCIFATAVNNSTGQEEKITIKFK